MPTIIEPSVLDKDRIAAMRKATDVILELSRDTNHLYSGTITAIQRKDFKVISQAYIFTAGSIYGPDKPENGKATCSIIYANQSDTWQTAVSIMKPGDTLSIRFEANLYRPIDQGYEDMDIDTCCLIIRRKDKQFKFILDIQLTKKGRYRMIN